MDSESINLGSNPSPADMKIHPAFCFTPKTLYRYLKSCSVFGKKEYEIFIALIYRKIMESEYGGNGYSIYFPPQTKYYQELFGLIGKPMKISDIGGLLDKYVEESSLTDVAFVQPFIGNQVKVLPCQIKRFGLGNETGGGTEILLSFLEKQKKFTPNENRLIISFEQTSIINLPKVIEWVNTNVFPFKEIVLFVQQKDTSIKFCQLKPNNGLARFRVFKREEIVNDLR